MNQELRFKIMELQSELDVQRMETATLRLQLINRPLDQTPIDYNKEQVQELLEDKKYNDSFRLSKSHQYNEILSQSNCIVKVLNGKERIAKSIQGVLHHFCNKFSGVAELVNNYTTKLNTILNEMSVETINGERKECRVEEVSKWRKKYKEQVKNLKKTICECRRLQSELDKLTIDNTILKHIILELNKCSNKKLMMDDKESIERIIKNKENNELVLKDNVSKLNWN